MKNTLNTRPGLGRPCDYQARFIARARALPEAERRRHASVCNRNGCACTVDAWPSFTCACEQVRQENGEPK